MKSDIIVTICLLLFDEIVCRYIAILNAFPECSIIEFIN